VISPKNHGKVKGEILELKNTINTMVDQLSSFASEVTRVAREVGTEGKLGGQADVKGVAGTWKDLTDNANLMASNLTVQLRDMSKVATAIASGDLTQKITVDVRGEILQIKTLSTRWWTSCVRSRRRSHAWRARSAPKVSLAARPPCPESLARGKI